MLKNEDLQRTSFTSNELKTLNLLPSYNTKTLTAPKELADCLYLLNQAQLKYTHRKNKIKHSLSQLTVQQRVSNEVQIARIERDEKRLQIYHNTILTHLTLNGKAQIIELYSLPNNPELFNYAKVQYGEHTFFIQLSSKFLRGKTYPIKGVMNSTQSSNKGIKSVLQFDLTETEAVTICSIYHKGLIDLQRKTKLKNQRINTHNTIVKKLKKLKSENKIEVIPSTQK